MALQATTRNRNKIPSVYDMNRTSKPQYATLQGITNRLDGRYISRGENVALPAEDGDCLSLFRTSGITHQNLSDWDCRRMLELMQKDDEMRRYQRNNGDCCVFALFMRRCPGLVQQMNTQSDGDHSPWHNLMGTHPFIPTWASAREQHRKQIERRDEEPRCAEALLQEKKAAR